MEFLQFEYWSGFTPLEFWDHLVHGFVVGLVSGWLALLSWVISGEIKNLTESKFYLTSAVWVGVLTLMGVVGW